MGIVRADPEGDDIVALVVAQVRSVSLQWADGDAVWAAMNRAFEAVRGTPIDRADAYDLACAFAVQSRLIPEQ